MVRKEVGSGFRCLVYRSRNVAETRLQWQQGTNILFLRLFIGVSRRNDYTERGVGLCFREDAGKIEKRESQRMSGEEDTYRLVFCMEMLVVSRVCVVDDTQSTENDLLPVPRQTRASDSDDRLELP